MANVKVQFNKQIMRKGKIIPVGVPFEVDEKEFPLLQRDGAMRVKQEPPELLPSILLDPDEVSGLITDEIGGSALFASRFRECAGRALLLPNRRFAG